MVGDVMPTNSVIDLSHHNGTRLRFNKAKTDGIVGVIQKATQGEVYIDPTFKKNRTAVLAAELPFGAYHFGTGSADALSYPGPAAALALDHFVTLFQQALALAILALFLLLDIGAFFIGHDILQAKLSRRQDHDRNTRSGLMIQHT